MDYKDFTEHLEMRLMVYILLSNEVTEVPDVACLCRWVQLLSLTSWLLLRLGIVTDCERLFNVECSWVQLLSSTSRLVLRL